jgi:hypothetical protein
MLKYGRLSFLTDIVAANDAHAPTGGVSAPEHERVAVA